MTNRESDQSKRDSAMMNDTFYKLKMDYTFKSFPTSKDDEITIQWPDGFVDVNTVGFARWLMERKPRPRQYEIKAMLRKKKELVDYRRQQEESPQQKQ